MPMARIRDVRVAKQADVDVELARRSSRASNGALAAANGSSERHTPHAAEGESYWVALHYRVTEQAVCPFSSKALSCNVLLSIRVRLPSLVACRLDDKLCKC